MNKKKIAVVLCVAVLSVGAFTFSSYSPTQGQTSPSKQPLSGSPLGTKQSPHPSAAPEHVVYRQFFRHLMALKERAKEIELQGKDGKALRLHYKDQIGLKDEHARILDKIAAECDLEVATLDARAKKLIDAVHARFPGGVVPPGASLPPPPPELKKMQRERDMVIMRARQRLRTALGEYGFQQVDDYVKLNFARGVKRAMPVPRQSAPSIPGDGN